MSENSLSAETRGSAASVETDLFDTLGPMSRAPKFLIVIAGVICLYLYLPMIPDMALLRDQSARFTAWRRWMYRKLSLGWTGTPEQWRLLERAISVMAIVIIPVAVSVHTVVSWVFSMTLRAGWHS